MDVFEAVGTALAVRQYQDKPVPKETVRRIVEAAHLTASSMNGQPWHFVIVQERAALLELGKLVRQGRTSRMRRWRSLLRSRRVRGSAFRMQAAQCNRWS